MNISAISSANYATKAVFKGRAEDLLKEHKITKNTPDDAVVTWGRQDSTYIYPITAGQIRKMAEEIKASEAASKKANAKAAAAQYERTHSEPIPPEKLYSHEFCG